MQPNQLLVLGDEAVEFLNKFVTPIMTAEYVGWVVPLPKKYKSVFVVEYSEDKYWDILHVNASKQLTKKQIIKSLRFLQDRGWLHPVFIEPFREFSLQLQVDPRHAIVILPEQEAKQKSMIDSFSEISMVYDDDTSGITLFDGESENGKR